MRSTKRCVSNDPHDNKAANSGPQHVVDVHPAALTVEHHIEVAVSPSLGAASLLTTPHRVYATLGDNDDTIYQPYGSPRSTALDFTRTMVCPTTLFMRIPELIVLDVERSRCSLYCPSRVL